VEGKLSHVSTTRSQGEELKHMGLEKGGNSLSGNGKKKRKGWGRAWGGTEKGNPGSKGKEVGKNGLGGKSNHKKGQIGGLEGHDIKVGQCSRTPNRGEEIGSCWGGKCEENQC